MPMLRPMCFEGRYTHPRTLAAYDYSVTCQIAVDSQGRESMQIRGRLARGDAVSGFLVTGQVDRKDSFIGRERAAAEDCVAVACERDVADVRWGSSAAVAA